PLGLAVPVFLYYNFNGLRANGFGGYLKQFLGPLPALSPLIFLIETISHLARILSLTVRLYANMLASDLLTLIAFSMVPLLVPVIPLGLHAFISVIQAFVFMLLTMIYLALAVAHEH
ncbi:MAG: F0F1 ATP synthase subunit A, partial [Terracidiphilus sp.]